MHKYRYSISKLLILEIFRTKTSSWKVSLQFTRTHTTSNPELLGSLLDRKFGVFNLSRVCFFHWQSATQSKFLFLTGLRKKIHHKSRAYLYFSLNFQSTYRWKLESFGHRRGMRHSWQLNLRFFWLLLLEAGLSYWKSVTVKLFSHQYFCIYFASLFKQEK